MPRPLANQHDIPEVLTARRAFNALYLTVEADVVDDVYRKFEAAISALRTPRDPAYRNGQTQARQHHVRVVTEYIHVLESLPPDLPSLESLRLALRHLVRAVGEGAALRAVPSARPHQPWQDEVQEEAATERPREE
jgi:hypothetical protein